MGPCQHLVCGHVRLSKWRGLSHYRAAVSSSDPDEPIRSIGRGSLRLPFSFVASPTSRGSDSLATAVRALLIAYDLIGTDESSANHASLIARIREYPEWANVQRSLWIVKTPLNNQEVRDDLWRFMHPSDRLFVVTLTHEAAWFNAICKNDWLQSNL